MIKITTPRPALDALFDAARKAPPMTKAERDAQRRSWVIGEMMLEHPEMTREEADASFDAMEAER